MVYFPIEEIDNANRYRRVEFETKLFLKITKDFLISQGLENSTMEEIRSFIDQSLEETPIDDINRNIIMRCSWKTDK